jgi:Domain of unknown function (DUF4190)
MTAPPPPDPPIQPYAPPPAASAYSAPAPYGYSAPASYGDSAPAGSGYSAYPGASNAAPGYYAAPAPYEQAYPAAPYQYGYSPYGPPQRPTDGLAIASLIVSCVSVLTLCAYGAGAIIGVVGAILGHVARRRIRESGAQGDGMALAGIIVGWITTALGAAGIAFLVTFIATNAFGSGLE